MEDKLHSVIVPVYNSRSTLSHLVERIESAMRQEQIRFELLLVDDGSKDGSFDEIRKLSKLKPYVAGFRLARNFGHQAAIVIALENCKGEYIGIIDDDLQDPPEILASFFKELRSGYDVVYGVRRKRKEIFIKRFIFALFYRLLKMMSKVEIPIDAGDFCVMKRSVVKAMLQFNESKPYLRGMRSWVGFNQIGIEYERDARYQGESGYTLLKYFSLALSGVLSFSYIPLRLSSILGVLSACIGFFFALYVVFAKLFFEFDIQGYTSLVVVITFLGGIQLICIGILGEYLARLVENVSTPRVAIVAERT